MLLQYVKRNSLFSKFLVVGKKCYYSKSIEHLGCELNTLRFPGVIIYVNDQNVDKYGHSILPFFKTDVIGLDTEFIITYDSLKKKDYVNIKKHISLLQNKQNENTVEYRDQKNYTTEKKYPTTQFNKTRTNVAKHKKILLPSLFFKQNKNKIIQDPQKTLCLVQLCSNNLCFIFNIRKLNGTIPIAVKEILENEKIIKVCHDVKNEKDLFLSQQIEIKNVFDLYNYAIESYIYPPSLQNLVNIYLNRFLDKSFQRSNWFNDTLTEEQLIYAAVDSYAARQIFVTLKSKQKVKDTQYFDVKLDFSYFSSQTKENVQCTTNNRGVVSTDDMTSEGYVTKGITQKDITIPEGTINKRTFNSNTANTYVVNDESIGGSHQDRQENEVKNYKDGQTNTQLISDLKKEIKKKCSQLNNVLFFEEVTVSNNGYKNVLYLQHVQHGIQLLKLYSHNHIEEEKCCRHILLYLNNQLLS